MSLNMKTLTQAFAKASAVIEKTVQTTVQEVTGLPKAMQDYNLLDQIASAGPGLVWKLYNAKVRDGLVSTAQYPSVCVWVLDKRAISEARQKAGISKASEDAFLDIIRADAARLVRLRHPGVVHVVQALDESKNAMAMVTEPLFASIANALGNLDNIANPPKELKGMEMGLLEVKHGLLQIAETLDFLHNNARLIHRGISPETILITSSGAWKFGGFGFTISADQASTGSSNIQSFHYAEYDVEDSILPLQPSMNYTAPELVRSKTPTIGSFSDIFSFGCLAYHLIARKPLFDCHNNVKMYMNSLTYLSSAAFTSIPEELVPDLQRMLSSNESIRPSAMDFTGSPFFRNDTRLRALRFLDHLLERDNMQKSEFLKALSDMWKDFDARVLRYKVLPPLCAELRNLVMQPMILPMVLTIAESQDKFDFEVSTLPALVPVLSTAAGDTLLLLVKNAELIISKASKEHLITHVLPMLVRAYDDNDNRLQEEVLKRTGSLAKQLDVQLVSKAILPRVHGLALKTTVAAVRVNALLCLSEMVHMLDKPAVIEILQTIQRCTAVDRSPPTLMCTLGVANSISKQYGIEFVAEHVLPLIMPLLIAQQLNVQQFAKYMLFVKETLRKIEEKRGVTLSDSGNSELLKPSNTSSINGGLPGHHARSSSATLTTPKRSPSWDEDWVSNSRSSTSTVSSNKPTTTNQPQPILSQSTTTAPPPLAAAAQKQQISSVPAVDVEWPPRSHTLDRLSDSEKMKEDKGDASFDEIDPFANWPPRTSTGSTTTSYNNNGGIKSTPQPTNNFGNFQTNNMNTNTNTNSWAFNTPSFAEPPRNTQGNYNNNLNSVGGLKSEQAKDIGSIFSSYKSEQSGAAPRLAPPPTTSVGRGIGMGMGRGRGRGNQGQPIRNTQGGKSQNEQTSLLDLL